MLARKRRSQLFHDLVVIETFDRGDVGMGTGCRIGNAGARRHAIDQHRAGTAHAMLTAKMGAGEIVRVADIIGEAGPRLHVSPYRNAIDRERHVGHAATAWATARRSAATRTVCSITSPRPAAVIACRTYVSSRALAAGSLSPNRRLLSAITIGAPPAAPITARHTLRSRS